MANKGYWITVGKLTSPQGLNSYADVLVKWLPTVGGSFLITDLASIEKEGSTGHSTVVIEFPSKEAAISAYESPEYQDMIAMRTPFSELQLTIVEGKESSYLL
ncbi:MAG: hypothetical protein CMI75_08110 [Candidatus Pelagibacter sp.]|nr:hypothetical protein [Candidatus Pelagibacter sp.]OUT94809.1 MAG: hypothetical protein CBB96_05155 [Gammaproteobacteria bacterium TMED36]